MESPHLEDIYSLIFYFVSDKQISGITQNNFCLITEHSGFMKHTSNKLNEINGNFFFTNQVKERITELFNFEKEIMELSCNLHHQKT